MKKFCLIIYFLIGIPWYNAFCQTHIFDRYASHTELEVAYLENIPLNETTTINASIIIAKDSAAWEWMKNTFHVFSSSQINERDRPRYTNLRNSQNPEHLGYDNPLECCLMVANYADRTIIFFQYSTIEQFKLVLNYITNQSNYEESKN